MLISCPACKYQSHHPAPPPNKPLQCPECAHVFTLEEADPAGVTLSSHELPEILRDGLPRPATAKSRMFLWFCRFGVLALLSLLALQWAWYERDRILTQHPRLVPYVRQICANVPCRVIRHRDTQAIQLRERDIRQHPQHPQHLLINVVLVNRLPRPQAWPSIQVILYDEQGNIRMAGRFPPQTYLSPDAFARHPGMPPQKPMHIALETTGDGDGEISSFAFHFL